MNSKIVTRITDIIHNPLLARSISRSIEAGINSGSVHVSGRTIWDIFKYSLDTAIRDIENDPRGDLFRRFLEYGPLDPDHPEQLTSDGKTQLSDPECGQAVQFIFSHMVNRFKGELAELLAIAPCLELVGKLKRKNGLPGDVDLFFGNRHGFDFNNTQNIQFMPRL